MKMIKKESWEDVVDGVKNNTMDILVLSTYGIDFLSEIDKEVLNNVERSAIGRNWVFLIIANTMAIGGLVAIFWIPWYAGIIITIIGFNWGLKLLEYKEWYQKKFIKITALQDKDYYDVLCENKAIMIIEKN